MPDEALQTAFEIKTTCDEISRKLLRWHWENKPGSTAWEPCWITSAPASRRAPNIMTVCPIWRAEQLAAAGYHPVYAGAAGP